MNRHELRRLCRGVLEDCNISPPLDAQELCERLARTRGREIKLIARDLPCSATFGALVPMPTRDLIIYPRRVAHPYRAHIIFHELIHLIRGHRSTRGAKNLFVCGRPLENVPGAKDRQEPDDHWQEWEAETGATILSSMGG
ncbi:MAG TPA: hypothetical protein VJ757_03610 [Pseudonocardiaceae bacterium]|nr:hypothetical protein [Pseudonocardiaceae bacterium]